MVEMAAQTAWGAHAVNHARATPTTVAVAVVVSG